MNHQTKSISLTAAGLAVAAVFAYTVPNTYAQFTTQTTSQNNSAAAGSIGVELVDIDGNTISNPVINIANAQPAMADQISTFRIANTGTVAADIRLYVTNLTASASDLNDVLNISIKDSQNVSLYNGSIANLDINFNGVAAGVSKQLSATVTWPDLATVDDNPYQSATLSFEFAVDSASVTV